MFLCIGESRANNALFKNEQWDNFPPISFDEKPSNLLESRKMKRPRVKT